jgi:hypothetical protein
MADRTGILFPRRDGKTEKVMRKRYSYIQRFGIYSESEQGKGPESAATEHGEETWTGVSQIISHRHIYSFTADTNTVA